MNMPFPTLMPRMIDPKWFNADSPCDEDAELTSLEQEYSYSLTSIGQKFNKRAPLGKSDQEPMEEEAESDEEGNDESDDTEESHDEDEELRTSYTPPRNNNDVPTDSADDLQLPDANSLDQSAVWPHLRS